MAGDSSTFLKRLDQYLVKLENNKYAIRTVADLIRENPQLSREITDLIVKRIRESPPESRVPLFYVMDSICKTCDPSFKTYFAPEVSRMILSTIPKVPVKSKDSILHMVDTWRTSQTFASSVIDSIYSEKSTSGQKRERPDSPAINEALWNHLFDGIAHLRHSRYAPSFEGGKAEAIARDAFEFHKLHKSPVPPLEALYAIILELGRRHPQLFVEDQVAASFFQSLLNLMIAVGARLPRGNMFGRNPLATSKPLPTQNQASSSRGNVQQSQIIVDFSPGRLRQKNTIAIAMLYERLPQQCEFCGLRFPDSELIASHLDWHFKENLRMKNREKSGACQNWYVDEKNWIEGIEGGLPEMDSDVPEFLQNSVQDTNASNSSRNEETLHVVYADEAQPCCPICGERFEQYWDDNHDDWMYRDAMHGTISDKEQIVHQNCFLDVGQ